MGVSTCSSDRSETHSAEHGNQSECIDWSLSISRDDVAGAKGTATLSVSHVPSHMVMRDPSVTNDAESTSSSQSSEAVEDDINDQNIVGEWDSGWPVSNFVSSVESGHELGALTFWRDRNGSLPSFIRTTILTRRAHPMTIRFRTKATRLCTE